ncbi:MAG: hypothetical protein SV062_04935 [Thermodesulfobacteriota bacterium]|nr:hypothetical protein [Thermodesulfobacteriota bacterium]
MAEYDMFVANLDELKEGEVVEKQIRDRSNYQAMIVKAIFSKDPEKLPDGKKILVRARVGHLLDPKPWIVKVIEVVKTI